MKLCALVVGHKPASPGAINRNSNLTEFCFNNTLVGMIESKVSGVKTIRVYRDTYKGLVGKINSHNPDFIISLHCNAFNTKASGTEVLFYHKSKNGEKMANILQDNLIKTLGLADRGTRAKTSEDRGGYLLRYTTAPCVIAEPFFIDNDLDLSTAQNNLDSLAKAYADSIEEIAGVI
jgi:N-acetylmuramoyl-L-alanine amidase